MRFIAQESIRNKDYYFYTLYYKRDNGFDKDRVRTHSQVG